MRMKIFCTVALFACLFIACEKDNDDYEPVKPPIEQPEKPVEPEEPEKPDEPTAPPSTDDIINIKIGDLNMIVGSYEWQDVIYVNNVVIAVSWDGYSVKSTNNGESWENPVKIGFNGIKWICHNNGILVVSGINNIAYSTNYGDSWTTVSVNGNWTQGVTYGNGKFLITNGDGSFSTSTDGKIWSVSKFMNIPGWTYKGFTKVIYDGERFCGIEDLSFSTSIDGETWDIPIRTYASQGLYNLAYGNGIYVAVGRKGDIVASSDGGKTWNSIIIMESRDFRGLTYANGKFIATNNGGYITTSIDGITWTTPEQIKDESGKVVTANLNGICAVH